jgi:hypothetical protein
MTGATFSGCLLSFFHRSLTHPRRHLPLSVGSYRQVTNESMDPSRLTVTNAMLCLVLVMVDARSYSYGAPSLRLLGRLWHWHPGYLNHVEPERECRLHYSLRLAREQDPIRGLGQIGTYLH